MNKKLIGVNKRVENDGKRVIWQATIKKTVNGKAIKFKKDAPYNEEGLYKCGLFYNIVTKVLNGNKAKQNIIPDKYKTLYSQEEINIIEDNVMNKFSSIL